jgi:hypothetical protein
VNAVPGSGLRLGLASRQVINQAGRKAAREEEKGGVREEENSKRGERTEHVELGEGPNDADLVVENAGRGPGDAGGVGVDAVCFFVSQRLFCLISRPLVCSPLHSINHAIVSGVYLLQPVITPKYLASKI